MCSIMPIKKEFSWKRTFNGEEERRRSKKNFNENNGKE